MKKVLQLFFLLILLFCFIPITFAEDKFYVNNSVVTDEISTIFEVIDNNDEIITFSTESVYDSSSYEWNYSLYLIIFSKENGELKDKIKIYETNEYSIYNEEIRALKINDNEALVAYGAGVLKINLNDYSIIKNDNNLNACRIKRVNDYYLLYYYSDLYIVDDDLNVLYESSEFDVYDLDVVDSDIYILDYNYSTDEDSITHYQYDILQLNDKLELISKETFSYEDDTKNMDVGYVTIGNFLKIGDSYYYVSHVIRKFSEGRIEDILGDVSPQDNGTDYSMMEKVGNYYVGVGYVIIDGVTYAFAEIFDSNLRSLQIININKEVDKNIEEGLSVVKNITLTEKGFYANGVFKDGPNDIEEGFTFEFLLYYNIETKTDGNGDIKVANSSKADEEIQFVVTPKEGYVLGEIILTDSFGKVLKLNNNTFTMPSADVLIEVKFLPSNPDTYDIAIYGLVFLSCVILFYIFRIIKKKKMINS